jgi:F0F1-type ATP synthase assembly protein I
MYDIPFRLLASIIIGFCAGMYLDKVFATKDPVFTIIFSVLGLAGGIWSCLKGIFK